VPTSLFLIFATAFVIGLSGAVMPGPVLAVCISESAKRGARAGPLLVLGHAIVELPLIVALAWGLSEVLEQSMVAGIIGVIGGLFLRQPLLVHMVGYGWNHLGIVVPGGRGNRCGHLLLWPYPSRPGVV